VASGSALGTWRRALRLGGLALVAVLPNGIKIHLYRWCFGYRIEAGTRIGLALIDANEVVLGPGTSIGHLSAILRVGRFETGAHARIGPLNLIRGGESVSLGHYSTVMRFNILNAIPGHDCTTQPRSILELRDGAIVVSGHRIDFTDAVRIGRNVIIGGRNSSLWTHNRQQTAPIEIGDFCYVGSEVRLAPGASLPERCILGLGSVLVGKIETPGSLVAGVPARVIRGLDDADEILIRAKTRPDIPDDLYTDP
jgi:acetyltransferase-like isoleucine patch superfamily enzyme